MKHWVQSFSTEEGKQIDESDEQRANASCSISRSCEPDSKSTREIVSQSLKQPGPNPSTLARIRTSAPFPKYFLAQIQAKSKRKSPQTLKWRFPSATEISPRFGAARPAFPNSRSPIGISNDESDAHEQNTSSPIDESLELDSNLTAERESHPKKHWLPTSSTEDGMEIDESEHAQNADSWMHERLESGSNVTAERDTPSEKQNL
jgi:hypothetical protein